MTELTDGSPGRTRSELLPCLGLVLVSCILALGLVEATLALIIANRPKDGALSLAVQRYYLWHERRVVQLLPECAQYDSVTTYILRPGGCRFANREFDTRIQINSAGFRGNEASLHEPALVVLGDSYGMGWGVSDDSTFPALLEQATGLKALNTSVSSYGTARELLALSRVNLSAARYLVIQYCENDFSENSRFVDAGGKLVVRNRAYYDSLVEDHRHTTANWPGKRLRYFLPVLRDAVREGRQVPTPEAEAEVGRQADAFLRSLELSPVPLERFRIVVTALGGRRHGASQFLGVLRERSRDAHWPGWIRELMVVDVMPALSEDDYFRYDDHIRGRGYVRVAALLAGAITADRLALRTHSSR